MPIVRIALTSGATFTIPADFPTGGTLKVECIGAGAFGGGSYSRSDAITGLTKLQKVFVSIGLNGSNTWFNKTNSVPVVGVTSTSDGCLAQGAVTASGGQSANSVGDFKRSGGSCSDVGNLGVSAAGGYGGSGGPNGVGGNGGAPNVSAVGAGGGGGGANGGGNGSGGTGGTNRNGTGAGTFPNGDGTGGGGGGGAQNASISGSASQEIIWTNAWNGNTGFFGSYGLGSGAGGFSNDVDSVVGASAGYGGGANGTGFGLIILEYDTGTIPVAGPYTEVLTAGSYWRVPNGVSKVTVQAIGAGGTGSNGLSQYGGGGGGYAATIDISVTSNTTNYIQIGTSNTTGAIGGDTWFNTSAGAPSSDAFVLAKGAGANTSATNGGGVGTTQYGATKTVGGNGGANFGTLSTNVRGGGGGGAAGPTGIGKAGGNGLNSATTGAGGGGGGANGGSSSAGANGTSTLGGNGGNGSGGSGAGAGAGTSVGQLATAGTNGGGGGGGANAGSQVPNRAGAVGGEEAIWTFQSTTYGPGGGGGGGGRAGTSGAGGNGGGYGGGGGSGGSSASAGTGRSGLLVLVYSTGVQTFTATGDITGTSSTVSGTAKIPFISSGQIVGAGASVSAIAIQSPTGGGAVTKERIFVKSFTKKFAS